MDSRLDIDPNDENGHVVFASFGKSQVKYKTALDEFQDTAPMMRPVMADIATRILYDRVYGICQHDDPHNVALSLEGYYPKEDLYEGSDLAMACRDFYRFNLADGFGISLTEFLEYPAHVAEDLIDIARAGQEVKSKALREFKLDK